MQVSPPLRRPVFADRRRAWLKRDEGVGPRYFNLEVGGVVQQVHREMLILMLAQNTEANNPCVLFVFPGSLITALLGIPVELTCNMECVCLTQHFNEHAHMDYGFHICRLT